MLLALAAVAALVRWPGTRTAAAVAAGAAALELAAGAASPGLARSALGAALPLVPFLTAAIWLGAHAERTGLAGRLAAVAGRLARGSRPRLYALACGLCALLTATVSLDGAVVLMVPVVLALSAGAPALRRALLFGTVAVANAFSLALPQGNPANVVVMERAGLGPGEFVARLLLPALAATLVCAGTVAVAERAALRGGRAAPPPPPGPASPDERIAAAGLVAAGAGGAVAPWLGVAPWWPVCAAAAVLLAVSWARGARPRVAVPARVCVTVAALTVLAGAAAAPLAAGGPASASLPALLAVALVASALAGAVNNLPASAVLASLLGAHPAVAGAALAGLSAGSLATPHGSVATALALERAAPAAGPVAAGAYLRLWAPTAAAAAAVAAAAIWAL